MKKQSDTSGFPLDGIFRKPTSETEEKVFKWLHKINRKLSRCKLTFGLKLAVGKPILRPKDASGFPLDGIFRKPTSETEEKVFKWLHKVNRRPFRCKLAFGLKPAAGKPILRPKKGEIPKYLWFVGDIHGDILALEAVIRLIDRETPEASVVFLGDMFDRHPHGYEVIIRILELIKERPGRILWLAGNHDIGLEFDDDKFRSACTPADFAEFLNGRPDLKVFGEQLCLFMKKLPRALFLPDGLLCTHGGVPHDDEQERFSCLKDLYAGNALNDFTWGRIHASAPQKRVNRTVQGSELGYKNVQAFFEKAERVLKRPVRRLVCGHQHPDDKGKGVRTVPGIPALILNTSVFAENIFSASPWLIPYIAKYRKGELPEAVPVELDAEETASFYETSHQD